MTQLAARTPMAKLKNNRPAYTAKLRCCRYNHHGNSATSDATVPGARGDKPTPKPLAIQPADGSTRCVPVCGVFNRRPGEMLITTAAKFERLAFRRAQPQAGLARDASDDVAGVSHAAIACSIARALAARR